MGTAAWVCFHCRSAVRRHTQYDGDVPCPNCSRPCTWIGHKIPVPPKRKRRDWSALHAWLAQRQSDREMQVHVARIRECTALRQEIDRLQARSPHPARSLMIRRLRHRLERLGG